MATTTIYEIADFLGRPRPRQDATIAGVAAPVSATSSSVVFAGDEASFTEALLSPAGLILSSQTSPEPRVMTVDAPKTAFARVYNRFFDAVATAGVHPSALVADDAVLGAGCEIGAGCVIESQTRLGAGCRLGPRVVVHAGTRLGDRVRVQAGAILGSDGFGYVRVGEEHLRFPQVGTLWIGDDVEIGANTTIDRGALGETHIGNGTKIDNLVHIAHNCVIGERVLIAAQAGLAGSITVEDDAMLGGQVGLGEKVTIGRGVILGGQGGVLPGKTLEGAGEIFWGTPARPVREYLRDLARLRKR